MKQCPENQSGLDPAHRLSKLLAEYSPEPGEMPGGLAVVLLADGLLPEDAALRDAFRQLDLSSDSRRRLSDLTDAAIDAVIEASCRLGFALSRTLPELGDDPFDFLDQFETWPGRAWVAAGMDDWLQARHDRAQRSES